MERTFGKALFLVYMCTIKYFVIVCSWSHLKETDQYAKSELSQLMFLVVTSRKINGLFSDHNYAISITFILRLLAIISLYLMYVGT